MPEDREVAHRLTLAHETARGPVAVSHADRGLSRPPLPTTRSLDQREVITVDIDERMDEAAAIEAAAPAGEPLWLKLFRTAFVGVAVYVAWLLLPPEAIPSPPIELPDPVQGERGGLSSAQLEAENKAIAAFTSDGPNAAVGLLQACIASEKPSHRVWRTYLVTLERLDRNDDLLAQSRIYATEHADRLEAAHFLGVAMNRQDIEQHRDLTTWQDVVADSFKQDLASTQTRLQQALELLGDHEDDWPDKARRAWHDTLFLDAALIFHKQWQCEETPFEHEFRDSALKSLGQVHDTTALNVIELKRDIYQRILSQWPTFRWRKTRIGRNEYSKSDVEKILRELETTANGPVETN
jgi:hypothetical protein